MILIAKEVGSKELLPMIRKNGVLAELHPLPYGDFAFSGNGPEGRTIDISVERKTLHDMLHCINDAHFGGYQKIGMRHLYDVSVLMVEGRWKPHIQEGLLMEGFKSGYGPCKHKSRPTMYSKLRRYLFSVSLCGVIVMYTRDMEHTAYDICELYHYFQKAWDQHTAMLEVRQIALPDLRTHPPLVGRWAKELAGVGVKYRIEAEKIFKNPIDLAQGDRCDWARVGVGPKTVDSIMKEIWGTK